MQVHTCAELRGALGDAAVDRVQVMPVEGGWQCGADQLPSHSVEIVGREVLLEGYGPEPVYLDVSWVLGQGAAEALQLAGPGKDPQ